MTRAEEASTKLCRKCKDNFVASKGRIEHIVARYVRFLCFYPTLCRKFAAFSFDADLHTAYFPLHAGGPHDQREQA